MASLHSHPHREIITDWYHGVEPDFGRFARDLHAALKELPCELISALILLSGFLIFLDQGYSLHLFIRILLILLSATACLLAVWAFIFTRHGMLKRIWAMSAIAGNLFYISFI